MYQFLISLGVIGLIISTAIFFAQWSDSKPVFYIALAWGGFFAIAVYGLHLMETYPVKQKPVQTIQSLALEEYQRCLISYDRDLVFKNRKMTEEQLCSNLNVIYKKQVLSNVKTK